MLDALGQAAHGFARHRPTARPSGPGLTSIDYLGLLATQHRRDLQDRLHLADPDGHMSTLPPWQVVNVITSGGLLTAAPSG